MNRVLWVVAAVACLARPAGAAGIPDAAREAIRAANTAWLPAMQRQDAAAIAEAYADDAVFVTATGESAIGRAGVEGLMRARFAASRVLGGRLEQDGLRMEGELIYEWGHADVEVEQPGGTRFRSSGRYLTVWKRDGANRWRIIRNLSLADR